MNQSRLLCLTHVDKAPEWFCEAVREALFKLDTGTYYRDGAQGLWETIRNGFDSEDQVLYEKQTAEQQMRIS